MLVLYFRARGRWFDFCKRKKKKRLLVFSCIFFFFTSSNVRSGARYRQCPQHDTHQWAEDASIFTDNKLIEVKQQYLQCSKCLCRLFMVLCQRSTRPLRLGQIALDRWPAVQCDFAYSIPSHCSRFSKLHARSCTDIKVHSLEFHGVNDYSEVETPLRRLSFLVWCFRTWRISCRVGSDRIRSSRVVRASF